ncbi:MAG TPA: ABC transporter permease, partial [Desulfobacteria bacterium]|nr:ABC transporter permease [Desulfobacteria bacterium]
MRTSAIIKRICQQMLRDKRTLALLFVAPLLMLSLMYFLFNSTTLEPKLGVVSVDSSLISALAKENITVKEY